ncbi:MAG: T9SS type A sorting domain-containing protein [Bacteroidales bacterium]
MKKIFTLCIAAFSMFNAAIAQESIPYKANWIALPEADADPNKGKPEADQSLWNLGGWSSISEDGNRPFFIAVSKGSHLANTMEFGDGRQEKEQTSWLISPAFDLSDKMDKIVTFKTGKVNSSSNISLFYSLNYNGDVKTATWNPIAENVIPIEQSGIGTSKMITVEKTIPVKETKVVFGIKAHNSNIGADVEQAKIRVTAFEINLPNSLENVTDLGINVYPNPVKDIININSEEAIEKAEIFNVSGQNVLNASFTNQISVSSLPAGYYILKVKLENGKAATHTFIKK